MAAQQQIARELHAAFPDELDRVGAAALAGAFTGAVSGALTALMDHDDAADNGEQRAGTDKPVGPPGAPGGTVLVGWADGRAPHHQVPPLRWQSHRGLLHPGSALRASMLHLPRTELVVHVPGTLGDGAGYDVSSFCRTGRLTTSR